MSSDPIDALKRHLLVRQLTGWLPAALRQSRRATVVLAYAGSDHGSADDALRVVAGFADRVRGHRLAVVVLAADVDDLPARLGAAETALPGEVSVHLVPGAVTRLPVALRAAGAAGAPTLAYLDTTGGATPEPAVFGALKTARAGEMLLALDPPSGPATASGAPAEAGFPLFTEVDVTSADGSAQRVVLGTGSEKSLARFKDALWDVGRSAGLAFRDRNGHLLDRAVDPDPEPLGRELLAEIGRAGPATVAELRRFVLTATPYRAADALSALAGLLAAGVATRDPADGRLGGDVLIRPARPPAG